MFLSFPTKVSTAVAAGLLAHWGYFVHGERDLQAANIARVHILAVVLLPCLLYQLQDLSVTDAVCESLVLDTAYVVALFTSIIIYRVFLSPLRNVPGPPAMRVSKLVHVWDNTDPTKQNCKMLHQLRAQYGDIVRTGPNEVTLFGWDAYYQVHGPESKCERSAYYDILHPMVSLDTTRDPVTHSYRRKLWEQAFSIKALDQNLPLVYHYADLLVEQLRKRQGTQVDLSAWFEYYSFDLMGMLGLTIDFKNLSDGEHPILWLWHIAHKKLGSLNYAPWIKHLLMGIPFVERIKYYRQFMSWANEELDRNIQENKGERSNIIGLVLRDAMKNGGIKKNWNWVLGDFVLVVAAGSDPVRQVLPCLLFYLIHEPAQLAHVREELQSVDIRGYHALQHLKHFNACIYETLRLNPAVPSAGLRNPPKGGMTVRGTFIPEGTTICTPQYSLFRDEACFLEPDEWIPERFTTRPELILNKSALVPWTIGRRSCLGKNLSLCEIRVAAALMISKFDLEPVHSQKEDKLFTHATDYFTTTPGPFHVVLKSC
ncbi:Cytochrome P450 [Penicillium occitanis (nom. inval.)]|nr:hypothetical protein PENOC_085540 [Penicillium occitanis (nom. inval.)]PCG95461.1 Cytochrome P450 [Penicillium occitanis (nom. inval.)]